MNARNLFISLLALLMLAGCAKRPKPWDNPELIKIEREDFAVLMADATCWGYIPQKDGSRVEFKEYFGKDGSIEAWMYGRNQSLRGKWDTSNSQGTWCASYNNGSEGCWLLYK